MNPDIDNEAFRKALAETGQLNMAKRLGLYQDKSAAVLKNFITEDKQTKEELNKVCYLADLKEPVTIYGETGCGKEIIAKALHGDRSGAFVPFNCTAIPETLVDSILFGHIKGTFTGADTDRTGLFESASGGTLFIDEIGEMPLTTQAKLLRVLQEKKIRPVGGLVERPINCRVVCATHRNLEKMVEDSLFREDLFWRLCIYEVRIKPLRERVEDVLEMIDFIDKENELTEDDRNFLTSLPLKGNYRELEARIKRILLQKRLALENSESINDKAR